MSLHWIRNARSVCLEVAAGWCSRTGPHLRQKPAITGPLQTARNATRVSRRKLFTNRTSAQRIKADELAHHGSRQQRQEKQAKKQNITPFITLRCCFEFSNQRTGSKLTTLFMAAVDSTTSSATGTLPPTRPVLPPCGTTGSRRALQWASTSDTCSQGNTIELRW